MAAWTWDQIKSTKTVPLEPVHLVMDREWGQRLGEAQIRMGILRREVTARPSDTTLIHDIDELAAEIEELLEQKPDKVCTFVFKSIPPDRYERITALHRPTKAQRNDATARGQAIAFNPDTFPAALVKACLVSPELTDEQIDEMWQPGDDDADVEDPDTSVGARFSSAELSALFMGAQTANLNRQRVE